MKVYLVYCQYGEEVSMINIYADKDKAQKYIDIYNSKNKYDAHWFFQEREVF
jgi:hypothetical protein